MRRKLFAVIVGGAIAGASSALIALAAFTDHSAVAAGDQQPSTLLESANGSGGTLATDPGSPAQTGGGATQGAPSGTVAGRSQQSGAVVAHGVIPSTPTPQPQAGGGQAGAGGDPWQAIVGPTASPSASPSASSTPSLPSLPGLPSATPSPGAPAQATPTPAPSGGGTVTVPVPRLPLPLPLPTLPPVCVLLICIKP